MVEIKTWQEAKKLIRKWLTDNEHSIKEKKDDKATFHFEIDYPPNTPTRQGIIQPKKVPDLILVVMGIMPTPQHSAGLRKMKPKTRDEFIKGLHRELLFKENQFRFEYEPGGILKRVEFTYPLYFDGLTKTNLFRGLDINHKTFLYVSMELSSRVGGPTPPSDISRMYG